MSGEIYALIAEDLRLALMDLENDNSQPRRRAVLRALSSLIEAMLDTIWEILYGLSLKNSKQITSDEAVIFKLKMPTLDSSGKLKSRPLILPVIPRFRFALEKLMKITAPDSESAITHEFWNLFEDFVKIRNRVIHPSSQNSIEISDNEMAMLSDFSKLTTVILNDTLADCLLNATIRLEQIAGSDKPELRQLIKSKKFTNLLFVKPADNKKDGKKS